MAFGVYLRNEFDLRFGSFKTLAAHYNVKAATDKFSVSAGVSRNSSNNDFRFVDSDLRNTNAQFHNTSFTGSFGYKLNATNILKIYSQFFDGERHFALLTPTSDKTKYEDFNTRNLFEWEARFGRIISKVKVAFLSEKYRYFDNLDDADPDFGKGETFIAKYDLNYRISNGMFLNAIADFTQAKGYGSDVGSNKRQVSSLSVLFRHQFKKIEYELGARKEATSNYDSPFLFSAGLLYKINSCYSLKWNGSHNFRIPTFNDLYWSEGGNPDLKPESSYQMEFGNMFTFKKITFSATAYAAKISDMIQWLPGTETLWLPQNVNQVDTYGVEFLGSWNLKSGNHIFRIDATYAYTVSKDAETGYQLIYIPYHKATGNVAYHWRKLSANYQALLNGEVFTRTDNNAKYNLDGYMVSNIATDYTFGGKDNFKLGFQVRNITNENYKVMVGRPFPGRNYNIYLTLNF
jgi:outer membrane cobalamin receptor